MNKFLVVLVVLAAAGVPAYIMARGGVASYDVASSAHPLGTLSAARQWLLEHGYESKPGPAESEGEAEEGGAAWTHHRFEETFGGSSGYFLCYVDLWADESGEIHRLRCDFPSRSRGVDASYTRSQGLALSLWVRHAGAEPTFRTDDRSPAHGALGLRSDLDGATVKASWVKRYTDRDRDSSICDLVTFELAR